MRQSKIDKHNVLHCLLLPGTYKVDCQVYLFIFNGDSCHYKFWRALAAMEFCRVGFEVPSDVGFLLV
jgi:hypothetical protein